VVPLPQLDLLDEEDGVRILEGEQLAMAIKESAADAEIGLVSTGTSLQLPQPPKKGRPPSETTTPIIGKSSNEIALLAKMLTKTERDRVDKLHQEWHTGNDPATVVKQDVPDLSSLRQSGEYRGKCGKCGRAVLATHERNKNEETGIYFHVKCPPGRAGTVLPPLLPTPAVVNQDSLMQDDLVRLMLEQNKSSKN
jgi:hypothetical protein